MRRPWAPLERPRNLFERPRLPWSSPGTPFPRPRVPQDVFLQNNAQNRQAFRLQGHCTAENRRALLLQELCRKSYGIPPAGSGIPSAETLHKIGEHSACRTLQKIVGLVHSACRDSAENPRASRLQGRCRESSNIAVVGQSACRDSAENRRRVWHAAFYGAGLALWSAV